MKIICAAYKIRAKGKRDPLIQNMINIIDPSANKKEHRKKMFEIAEGNTAIFKSTHGQQHEFYRNFFNGVDLLNRAYYSSTAHFRIKNWRAKITYSLLSIALINCWTKFESSYDHPTAQKYLEFKRSLILKLMGLEDKKCLKIAFARRDKEKKKN